MKQIYILLISSLLISCGGSSQDDLNNTIKDGVRADGSCSEQLVTTYNRFNSTFKESAPFPESQIQIYNQNLQRFDLCEKLKVNIEKGTQCSVQNGNLDFLPIKPACAYATEVKAAKSCSKDFMKAYVSLASLHHNTEVLRLMNIKNAFSEKILENLNAMKLMCQNMDPNNFESVCLNDNYSKTIGGRGPALGYVVGTKDLDSQCAYADSFE